jgi:hypothetical protein
MGSELQPFVPANLDQALALARLLSESALIPKPLQGRPGDTFVVLITGHELGLSPMQALRGINVVDGKPVIGADLMVALCLRTPAVCRFFRLVSSDAQSATYETHRHGQAEPARMRFTIEEAKAAGLLGKMNWQKYPAAMLRARCSSALARAVYPDLLFGVYEVDEIEAAGIADSAPAALRSACEASAARDVPMQRIVIDGEVIPVPRDAVPIEIKAEVTAPERPTTTHEPFIPAEDDKAARSVVEETVLAMAAARNEDELQAAWRCPKWLPEDHKATLREKYSAAKKRIRTPVAPAATVEREPGEEG